MGPFGASCSKPPERELAPELDSLEGIARPPPPRSARLSASSTSSAAAAVAATEAETAATAVRLIPVVLSSLRSVPVNPTAPPSTAEIPDFSAEPSQDVPSGAFAESATAAAAPANPQITEPRLLRLRIDASNAASVAASGLGLHICLEETPPSSSMNSSGVEVAGSSPVGRFVVLGVDPDGLAAAAGITVGDVVVAWIAPGCAETTAVDAAVPLSGWTEQQLQAVIGAAVEQMRTGGGVHVPWGLDFEKQPQ
jgi:hypothetical protein